MSASRAATAAPPFPVKTIRTRFPALRRARGDIFFDNAAGAQVPEDVIAAIEEQLIRRNVNRGGRYLRSADVDQSIFDARQAVASFLGLDAPSEIVFGLNSTSLLRTLAEASRPLFRPGDQVIVTQLDHEANVGPWLRLERDGVVPLVWKVRGGREARLEVEDLGALLEKAAGRVRLVAMPLASNAIGRIVDVAAAARLAREAGALTVVDAVHYGPHGPIHADALGADFLVFSGYKIFGPHVGFLWGRADALRRLEPVRDFFIPREAPYGYEAGTQGYESMAGMAAALRYVMEVGTRHIRGYEMELTSALLEEIRGIPGLAILGDSDPERVEERVPTVAFTIEGRTPRAIVERLAGRCIHARDGHLYAPRLMEALGIDPEIGAARISLCHYNTREEITKLGAVLRSAG